MLSRRFAPLLLLVAVALSGCGYAGPASSDAVAEFGPGEIETVPQRSATETSMLAYGDQIESLGGFDIDDDQWLLIQAENCGVARQLDGGDYWTVSWFIPTVRVHAPYDREMLMGATVAASLITNCPTLLDSSWRWPELWGFLAAQGGGSSRDTWRDHDDGWGSWSGDGYQVPCDDGTWSTSGGIQGACSHHGGVAG